MDAGDPPLLSIRPIRGRCGSALSDREASPVRSGCYREATGEVWVETQPAEVLDCVLPGQSSPRGACVQAVYFLGLHLQAPSRQEPPRQDHPMLPARGESGGEEEDAANDQELETDETNPGQHWRAGGPIQPYFARM